MMFGPTFGYADWNMCFGIFYGIARYTRRTSVIYTYLYLDIGTTKKSTRTSPDLLEQ